MRTRTVRNAWTASQERAQRRFGVRSHIALGVAILVLFLAGFLGYLGYFGGPVFTVVPAAANRQSPVPGLAAVVLSGDTGFRVGMGPRIAERLADRGIPVVGVNSLTYFRKRRTIAETEALIVEATRRALAQPGTDKVALIGQSFGADALEAGLPELPEPLRKRVLMVGLVVPGDTVNFRASPQELFNFEKPDMSALPTARKLDWVPAVCIRGEEEEHSLCPLLRQPNVWRVTLPGGHMLHRNANAVAEVLLTAIDCAARPGSQRHGPCTLKAMP